jgi:tight adherence protein C
MTSILVPVAFALGAYLLAAGLLRARHPALHPWREAMHERPHREERRRPREAALRTRGLLDRLRAPSGIVRYGERILREAGLGDRMSGQRLVAISLLAGTLAPAWLLLTAREALGERALAVIPVAGILGLVAPWVVVSGRAQRRRDEVERALPDVLDLITVSVEAGLALEAALTRVAQHGRGPLNQELRRTLSEIGLGRRRREALHALAERTGVAPVRSLVNAMNQAERSGMQLGPVLRAQAEQLRQRRRQRAEEAAMKAPLKMLFPLVAFIFPTMFVVLMGPAAIDLMSVFGS